MTPQVWLDIESFSATPINQGVDRYSDDPQAEIMIRALALDDGPVLVRDLTPGGADWLLAGDDLVPCPPEYVEALDEALADPDAEVWAQNSRFDRTMERKHGLNIPLERWRDTMVQALAHSLPGALGAMCEALKLPADKAKDKEGKALIRLFCIPQPFKFRKRAAGEKKPDYDAAKAAAEAAWPGRATRESHPAEWRKFLLYAGQDIVAMRAAHKIMPKWNYPNNPLELALWQLDQRINDRGVYIDLELAECALNAVDAAQLDLRERTMELTGGEVESATKRDAMLEHILAEYGVDLPDMQSSTLERRIADPDLPEALKELLRVRLQASTSSTSKYKVLVKATNSDSRLRGLLQFCGASRTGRWAGRLWQPQNLPRPTLSESQIELGIEALKGGFADLVFNNVMQLTSSAIRGCVTAPPGRKLVVSDLSNIEGRVLAWLAGERWKLKAFRDFDNGTGHDLYALAYAKSFGVTPEVVMADKKAGGIMRQVGKVQELALGYEGGVGAFLTCAAAYGIDLEAMAPSAKRAIPGDVWGRANIMYEWHVKQKRSPEKITGLSKDAWLMCESFKLAWRDAHPATVQLWRDLDAAVRDAITTPGTTFHVGALKIRKAGAWLRIVLPSGRCLCYPGAALVPEKKQKNIDEHGNCLCCGGTGKVLVGGWQGELDPSPARWEICTECPKDSGRTVITYLGMNQYTRRWERITTYSGKVAENVTQAVARDVMAANMPGIEAAGYDIVLSVHDELPTESEDDERHSAAHLSMLLAENPPWAPDMPLAAAGFEAYRYKKD